MKIVIHGDMTLADNYRRMHCEYLGDGTSSSRTWKGTKGRRQIFLDRSTGI